MQTGLHLLMQSVVDVAWTPDGYRLLACSTDGTVAVLQFDTSELGVPLSKVSDLPFPFPCTCYLTGPASLSISAHVGPKVWVN